MVDNCCLQLLSGITRYVQCTLPIVLLYQNRNFLLLVDVSTSLWWHTRHRQTTWYSTTCILTWPGCANHNQNLLLLTAVGSE